MSWLRNALSSSLGRKYVMGLTGLLLVFFLVVHLGGNLLMYAGPESYEAYAFALHRQVWLLRLAEASLVVLFGLHIYLALTLTTSNRDARDQRYAVQQTKIADRNAPPAIAPERWMFISGAILLGFLVLHLVDFTFEARPDIDYEGKHPFEKALTILRNPITAVVYIAGSIVVGFHLGHGVASSCRSLGVNHPRYNKLIHTVGVLLAWVLAAGFASFPIWAMLYDYVPPPQ